MGKEREFLQWIRDQNDIDMTDEAIDDVLISVFGVSEKPQKLELLTWDTGIDYGSNSLIAHLKGESNG